MNLDNVEVMQQLDESAMLGTMDAQATAFASAWAASLHMLRPWASSESQYRNLIIDDESLVSAQAMDFITHIYPLRPGVTVSYTGFDAQSVEGHSLYITVGQQGIRLQDHRGSILIARTSQYVWPRMDIATIVAHYLAILYAADLLLDSKSIEADCDETVRELELSAAMLTATVPATQNPAKRLAGQMMNRLPLILGSGLSATVAAYWKQLIQINAKSWAQSEDLRQPYFKAGAGIMFPEFLMQKMHCVFIAAIPAMPGHGMDPIAVYFLQNGLSIDQLAGHGQSALAQLLTLLQFGAYTSYYLAMAYGVDPTPTLID